MEIHHTQYTRHYDYAGQLSSSMLAVNPLVNCQSLCQLLISLLVVNPHGVDNPTITVNLLVSHQPLYWLSTPLSQALFSVGTLRIESKVGKSDISCS